MKKTSVNIGDGLVMKLTINDNGTVKKISVAPKKQKKQKDSASKRGATK